MISKLENSKLGIILEILSFIQSRVMTKHTNNSHIERSPKNGLIQLSKKCADRPLLLVAVDLVQQAVEIGRWAA